MEKNERESNVKNYNQINFNYLKFFIEAAEASSLQEVADKMKYEISNVSSSITNFEKQLGVKLFTRNPLKLTETGRDIYDIVKKAYREIEFTNIIARNNNIEFGRISMGCPLNLTKAYMMDKIKKAIKDYPNLQVKIDCETDYKKIINRIQDNTIQFALLDFIPDNDDLKGFKIEELFNAEYIFVSNKNIEIKSIEELSNYKFITSEEYRFTTLALKRCFEKYNLQLNQSMICSITEARIKAAKMGLGIAYTLKDFVKEELKNKELYEVKLPIELPKTTVNLIYLKDRLTRVDKKFINNYLKK